MRSLLSVAAALALSAQALPAAATECGLPLTDPQEGNSWRYEVDVVLRADILGFEPANIFPPADQRDDPNAAQAVSGIRKAGAEVRGRIRLYGRWLHFELQAYTHVPADSFMVTDMGLEAWAMVPLANWARVGLYHHSSHNVSDSTYGYGLDLDAAVVDLAVLSGDLPYTDGAGKFRLRTLGYWFIKGWGSPYVWTGDTNVQRSAIPDTKWRGVVQLDAGHPLGRLDCSATVQAEQAAPVSLQAGCDLGFRLGPNLFGALGDHLLVGPFGYYRRNFSRTDEFGVQSYVAGVSVDLLVTDDPVINRR